MGGPRRPSGVVGRRLNLTVRTAVFKTVWKLQLSTSANPRSGFVTGARCAAAGALVLRSGASVTIPSPGVGAAHSRAGRQCQGTGSASFGGNASVLTIAGAVREAQ